MSRPRSLRPSALTLLGLTLAFSACGVTPLPAEASLPTSPGPLQAQKTTVTAGPTLAAGLQTDYAIEQNGKLLGWGSGTDGRSLPEGAKFPLSVSSFGDRAFALSRAGGVVSLAGESVPGAAQRGIVAFAPGQSHAVAVTVGGDLVTWGDNFWGQMNVPEEAKHDLKAVAAGRFHSLAIKRSGAVVAWGYDVEGDTAVPGAARQDVVAVAAGYFHSLALTQGGEVIAWGSNGARQTNVPEAARRNVIAIAAGPYRSLAVTREGRVIVWGDDFSGSGEVDHAFVPARAQRDVVAVSAGVYHNLALRRDGQIVSWDNTHIPDISPEELDVPHKKFLVP